VDAILRPTGVIAATLALVTVSSDCSGSRSAEEHSCGPTDQRFIQTASVDMTYGLANFAHDILAQAQPVLYERGCDVEPML
jgi:hypothetical protein